MHHCLYLEEILRVIFDYVDAHEYDPVRFIVIRRKAASEALAALARTCRTFQGPALDVLWREIPSLFVLIGYLMPLDIIKLSNSVLSFKTEPTAEDWKRLDPYFRRIRTIGTPLPHAKPRTSRPNVDVSVLQSLVQYLRTSATDTYDSNHHPFIPNITNIIWDGHWRAKQYMELLVGPGLRALQLPAYHFLGGTPHHWIAWHQSPTRALQRFAVSAEFPSSTATDFVRSLMSGSLRALCHLREVSIPFALLDADAMSHLASLRTLSSFEVHFPGNAPSILLPTLVTAHRLSRLRKLSLNIGYYHNDSARQFVEDCIDTATLDTFVLSSTGSSASTSMLTFANFLARLDPSSMRELSAFSTASSWRWHVNAYTRAHPFCISALPALMRYGALRALRLEHETCPFVADTASLLALADALPLLEVLSLCSPATRTYDALPDDVLPTLDGLLPVVRRCRHLRVLRLPVRSAFLRSYLASFAGEAGFLPSPVRSLGLWATPLECNSEPSDGDAESAPTSVEVASFLERAFPSIEELQVVIPEDETFGLNRQDDMRGWSEVVERLSAKLDVTDESKSWLVE